MESCLRRIAGNCRDIDESGLYRHRQVGVAYAEPPKIFPSKVLSGGKGTLVSGRSLGPIVSDVLAGERRPGRERPSNDEKWQP